MFQFPSSPRRKVWIAALVSMAASSGLSHAENFTMMVANPDPLGLGAFVPSALPLGLGGEGAIKGDFSYGIAAQSQYNSNFFQTESNEESEFAEFVNPWISYTTDPEGGATYSLVANYRPTARWYFENSDLSGFDQSGDLTFKFRGSRTTIEAFGRYSQYTGTDLLTGEFVEGTVATTGIRGSRQIASRTSLDAGWSFAESDYGSGPNTGATVQTGYLSGYWQATERLSFGPSLRYTTSESDTIGTRDAWALMFSARYRAGERTYLSASIGPEYSTTSGVGGGDDSGVGVTGNLTASYMINERWTWRNSINSAAVPSPNQTNFVINNVTVTSVLDHALLHGSVAGGLDYNLSNFNDVGTVTASRSAENNLAFFLRYGRGLFHDRIGFNSEVRYTFNDGVTDWTQVVVSAGLSVAF